MTPEPEPDSTADPTARVTAAAAELDGLDGRPLSAHVEVYERLHAALTDALSAPTAGPTSG